jgi:membrane protein DedA with SNARE-associated domain
MYALARRRGPTFFTTGLGRKLVPAAALDALREAYARHGVAGIFFSRFLPGVRAGVTPFAGVVGLSPARTLIPAAAASAIWYAALVGVAGALGLDWPVVRGLIERASTALGVAAAFATLILVLWLVRRSRRRRA